jgi:hypothetical protein
MVAVVAAAGVAAAQSPIATDRATPRLSVSDYQNPKDAMRAAELQERVLIDGLAQQERDQKARQERERRQFEKTFNKLVDALGSFSSRYNGGHGQTWPAKEAEELKRAIRELQSSDKSLQAKGAGCSIDR